MITDCKEILHDNITVLKWCKSATYNEENNNAR